MSDPDFEEVDALVQAQVEEDKALADLKAEVKKLQVKNDNAVARMVHLGMEFDPADIGRQRDNHLCAWIYENLLTDEAQQHFLKSWHEKFGAALERTEKNARMAMVASSNAVSKVRSATPGAAVPGGAAGGLILPGHLRRSGS